MKKKALFFVCCFSFLFCGNFNHAIPAKVTEQLPFVIIIPSYNNEKFCWKNFTSAVTQEYDNYRIIYIDDASTDRTASLVKKMIKKYKASQKSIFIQNKKNQGAMYNWYHAIHSCKDSEIVISLDGDDHLIGKNVLSYLNSIYQNKNVWMTYGSYRPFEDGRTKESRFPNINRPFELKKLKNVDFRQIPYCTSHLRTFYARLFKKIKKEDFFYQGKFVSHATDVAQMIPMLEMSRMHAFYVSKPLYAYRRHAGNDDLSKNRAKQVRIHRNIKMKKPYAPLSELF